MVYYQVMHNNISNSLCQIVCRYNIGIDLFPSCSTLIKFLLLLFFECLVVFTYMFSYFWQVTPRMGSVLVICSHELASHVLGTSVTDLSHSRLVNQHLRVKMLICEELCSLTSLKTWRSKIYPG